MFVRRCVNDHLSAQAAATLHVLRNGPACLSLCHRLAGCRQLHLTREQHLSSRLQHHFDPALNTVHRRALQMER